MKVSKIRNTLQNLVSGKVLWENEILKFYSVDSSLYQVIPKVVVIPNNEKEVISVVKFANENKISVTVRGSGPGLVGSALNEGIILDLKNLNKVSIHKNFVKVGSGAIKGTLDRLLKKERKFFPPNPSIGPYCSLGGIIGNNSSGSRTLKYGSAIDNIQEITFVNGLGNKITLPKNKKLGKKILKIANQIEKEKFPKVTKNSCGYRLDLVNSPKDTHKILVGSEGTLGIVLSAKLKIKPEPSKRRLFVIVYRSIFLAARDCKEIIKSNPSSLEFVDYKTLRNIDFKFDKNTRCLLFVEYDSRLNTNTKIISRLTKGKIIKKLFFEIEKWWKYRNMALTYSLKTLKAENLNPHIIEDATVPLEKLEELFVIVNQLNKKFRIQTVMYGHAGNGNIHVRIISQRPKIKVLEKISETYFAKIINLGGTITGEHGDGIARSEFVKKQYGQKNFELFREIKDIFDPNKILNPGKITSHKKRFKKLQIF